MTGNGNNAAYEQLGLTLTSSYEFDFATLTMINSYWSSEGFSRGDVDGAIW